MLIWLKLVFFFFKSAIDLQKNFVKKKEKKMAPIHWLRFLQRVKTNIDGHYVLKNGENFQVFTSKPINGIKCHKITDTNIRGKATPQYLAEPVHKFNCQAHKLTQPNECNVYYAQNKEQLAFYEEKLKTISEKTEQWLITTKKQKN